MSHEARAKEVVSLALKEMIREIAQCGSSGGVGRVQNYAPVFNNLYLCMKNLNEMTGEDTSTQLVPEEVPKPKDTSFAERMIAARAAKKSGNK